MSKTISNKYTGILWNPEKVVKHIAQWFRVKNKILKNSFSSSFGNYRHKNTLFYALSGIIHCKSGYYTQTNKKKNKHSIPRFANHRWINEEITTDLKKIKKGDETHIDCDGEKAEIGELRELETLTLVTKTVADSTLQRQQRRSSRTNRRRTTQVEQTSWWPHDPYATHRKVSAQTAQLSSILNPRLRLRKENEAIEGDI